jgi:hypothetical protein
MVGAGFPDPCEFSLLSIHADYERHASGRGDRAPTPDSGVVNSW